jgi:hypothetical protein
MPLISPKIQSQPQSLKIMIEAPLYQEIDDYCAWAKFKSKDQFFEEAARFILSKDIEWKAKKKSRTQTPED